MVFVIRPRTFVCVLLLWCISLEAHLAPQAHAQLANVPMESNFTLVSFDQSGDGYNVTFRNESPNAYSNFEIVIDGMDIGGITVFRREILIDFMEGQSERTFFVPGYDKRVFEVKFKVLAPFYILPFSYFPAY